MRKHNTMKKAQFSKRSKSKQSGRSKSKQSRSKSKQSRSKQSRSKRSIKSTRRTKKIFFHKKNKSVKKIFRGGDEAKYPQVYGIENRSVLYPISKYGIPAGPFDPPALSNGPNGNGTYPGVLYGVYGGNGGGGHKRSGYKRSGHKRSGYKRSGYKRSGHKRSGHKRSGHKRKVRRSKYHGGGGSQSTFFPQPVVNATRSLTGGLTEIANGFGGYTNSNSLNPMPYSQPALDANVKYVRTDFPNVAEYYNKADGYVSNL